MKTRFFPTLSLFILLLASCAPAAVTPEAPSQSATQPAALPAVRPSTTSVLGITGTPAEPTVEAAASTPLPVATSRGPDLHATDPDLVNLASGGLQLVEFIRFT